ncbi:cytochrome ubiquinol oxidase subunit I [Bordetella sp. 15P40C-2]|uniref:cytochrome ubiquinol oxidase subunit I n=1 Tax=Bordetella sp. 15P40C-2 TaxID=2572246 RepID=UPI0013298655|nr:cytochrome ubiquinol oxidase subunit I [Bordetella sp. 15P40C-2]MVW73489.1 cytochrome ubiquinol oxidase subunit I [Bordetella sp. 15P40C-2]
MDIVPLLLARIQFTASLSFLALFLALAFALAWFLLFFKLRAHATGAPGWTAAYRFWVRFFALAFVLAFASALPVLIQLGSLWPGLMEKIGNVAAPLLSFGVLSVFILKSCFLGVMLFGQRRVSNTAHTFAVFMVAVGQSAALFWMLVLQSWVQTPAGATLIDARYRVLDWGAIIINPSLPWNLSLMVLWSALAAAFLMLGITALQALRRPLQDGERCTFKTALVVAMVASTLQFPALDGAAKVMAEHQPAKAAAAAGFWHSGSEPSWSLIGIPDSSAKKQHYDWPVYAFGAAWLGHDDKSGYLGLDKFSGMRPPVGLTFWSLRVMLLLGALMWLVSWWCGLRTLRRHLDPGVLSPRSLRLLVGMLYSGGLVVLCGGIFSMVGMQPYAVNGAITQSEILGTTSTTKLALGLVGYGVLYAVLIAAFNGMLFHAARYGVVPVRKPGGQSS